MTVPAEPLPYDTDIAAAAALIADSTRAAMLRALLPDRPLAAGELARLAGVSAATASFHLAKLLEGGLITVIRQGRHRYYRLAGHKVAAALEALGLISPGLPVRSLRRSREAAALPIVADVVVDGSALTVDDVIAVARGRARVRLGDDVPTRMEASRSVVVEALRGDAPVYGVNTGFGALADTPVGEADLTTLQVNDLLPPICRTAAEAFPSSSRPPAAERFITESNPGPPRESGAGVPRPAGRQAEVLCYALPSRSFSSVSMSI